MTELISERKNQRISNSLQQPKLPKFSFPENGYIFNDLPLELFFYIITFLDATYILRCHAVCRKWRHALTQNEDQFWLHLGAQHFPEAMERRRTYLSQINPPLFYWQQYRSSLKHQRKLLEQIIRDLEHHLVTKSPYIRQVCVFLPSLAKTLSKAYQIDKNFGELPMAEDMEIENDNEPYIIDESSSFTSPSIRAQNDDSPYSYESLLKLNTKKKHGKTSFIVSLNENEVSREISSKATNTKKYRRSVIELLERNFLSIFQSWAHSYLNDRLHMRLFRPISVYLQHELMSSSGNRLLLLKNNSSNSNNNNNIIIDEENNSQIPSFVVTSKGFTVQNRLLKANGAIYRTAIYCKLLTNT